MPLFEYECSQCRQTFESYKRPFEDASVEKCPACGGRAAKVEISHVSSAGSGTTSSSGTSSCGSGSRRFPFS